MFWNKREKELEEKIKKLEFDLEMSDYLLQLLSIAQAMEILEKEKLLEENELIKYGQNHVGAIVNFASHEKYFRETFIIKEGREEEYAKEMFELSVLLLEISRNNYDKRKGLYYSIEKIIKYANPENGYNIAKVF